MATKKQVKKNTARTSTSIDEVLTTSEAAFIAKQSVSVMRDAISTGDIDGTPRKQWRGRSGFRVLHADVIAWVQRGMTPHPMKPSAGEP